MFSERERERKKEKLTKNPTEGQKRGNRCHRNRQCNLGIIVFYSLGYLCDYQGSFVSYSHKAKFTRPNAVFISKYAFHIGYKKQNCIFENFNSICWLFWLFSLELTGATMVEYQIQRKECLSVLFTMVFQITRTLLGMLQTCSNSFRVKFTHKKFYRLVLFHLVISCPLQYLCLSLSILIKNRIRYRGSIKDDCYVHFELGSMGK